jgi:rhamnulokinase
MTRKNFLAIDIGASSGRIFVGRLDQFNLKLEEAHRFSHSIQIINGTKRWNWKQILSEIFTGLNTACNITGNEKIESVCCDSWSQDFGLLDSQGELFYEPVSYRDKRTEGLPFGFSDVIEPLNLLKRNGSAVSPITTLCQLYSMTIKEPEIIRKGRQSTFYCRFS